MENIIFNYDKFYDWHSQHLKNTEIFENGNTIEYLKYDKGSVVRISAFKIFSPLTKMYGNRLSQLDQPRNSYKRLNAIYFSTMLDKYDNQWLFYIFPTVEVILLWDT